MKHVGGKSRVASQCDGKWQQQQQQKLHSFFSHARHTVTHKWYSRSLLGFSFFFFCMLVYNFNFIINHSVFKVKCICTHGWILTYVVPKYKLIYAYHTKICLFLCCQYKKFTPVNNFFAYRHIFIYEMNEVTEIKKKRPCLCVWKEYFIIRNFCCII